MNPSKKQTVVSLIRPIVAKKIPSKISPGGMRANPAAKLGEGVGVWAKFWSGDRVTAMSHAELIRGPWIRHSIQDTSRNTPSTPLCACGIDSERHGGTSA
jgi:hypothetical protein